MHLHHVPHASLRARLRVAMRPTTVPVAAGDATSLLVRIVNPAPVAQRMTLCVRRLPDGWTAGIPCSAATVPGRAHVELRVVVAAPLDACTGDRVAVHVRAVGSRGPARGTQCCGEAVVL